MHDKKAGNLAEFAPYFFAIFAASVLRGDPSQRFA
jgi:hypothetical protein